MTHCLWVLYRIRIPVKEENYKLHITLTTYTVKHTSFGHIVIAGDFGEPLLTEFMTNTSSNMYFLNDGSAK